MRFGSVKAIPPEAVDIEDRLPAGAGMMAAAVFAILFWSLLALVLA